MAKGDGKPRGRVSSYAYFVQACREEHKRIHPNENVVFLEFSRKCAGRWKTMNDHEKKRFQSMAERDKGRYESEMSHCVVQPGAKKGKQKKDPNAPKRALSTFFHFCNDERPKVKAQMGEASIGEVAKEMGRRWQNCTGDQRAKYEALAARDKQRYEREMAAYKRGGLPPAQGQHEEYDEDDMDDEEEDE